MNPRAPLPVCPFRAACDVQPHLQSQSPSMRCRHPQAHADRDCLSTQLCQGCSLPKRDVEPREPAAHHAGRLSSTSSNASEAAHPRRYRGLGDLVAAMIHWITLGGLRARTGCGCERRRQWLNRWWPF